METSTEISQKHHGHEANLKTLEQRKLMLQDYQLYGTTQALDNINSKSRSQEFHKNIVSTASITNHHIF